LGSQRAGCKTSTTLHMRQIVLEEKRELEKKKKENNVPKR
jgi:hypothetical protein